MSWIYHPKYASIEPYLRLLRLHQPTGIFLLLWPSWWSIGFAMQDKLPIANFVMFAVGAILMRSAGCVINDIIDRDIDKKVERTKKRPLANGEITVFQATTVLFLLLFSALCLLMFFNKTTIVLGIIIFVPIIIYPFMKRFTYWPQIFLGLTFNWGALMGWAAVRDELSFHAILIYFSGFLWTMAYDTIYAHQDKKDDAIIGVKSTALKFGITTKKYISFFFAGTTILLWINGIIAQAALIFHVMLLLAALQIIWQITTINFDDAEDCMAKFRSNRYYGLLIFIGIIGGMIFQY